MREGSRNILTPQTPSLWRMPNQVLLDNGAIPEKLHRNLNRSDQKTSIPFRPDIEGLRALAIGLVIASHAGLPLLRGGFVGVDVFLFFPVI